MKKKYGIEVYYGDKDEVQKKLNEIDYELGDEIHIGFDLNPTNLHDEQKYEIIVKMYNTLTLDQLQELETKFIKP